MKVLKFVKIKTILIIIAVFMVSGALSFLLFAKKSGPPYFSEKAALSTVVLEISEDGTIGANQETNLGFKTSGRIKGIYVEEGDRVEVGQTLIGLDPSDLNIQLKEAGAALKTMQEKRANAGTSLESTRQELVDAQNKAETSLDNAYNEALTVLDDAYVKAYNAFTNADSLTRTYLSSITLSEGTTIMEKKQRIKNDSELIKSNIDKSKSADQEGKDAIISDVRTLLEDVGDSLKAIRDAIETSLYRDIVSVSDKSSLDTQRGNINTALSSVVSAQQGISTAKVENEANINSIKSAISELEDQLKENDNGGLYRAQIEEAQANVSLLQNQIQDLTLKSPSKGMVVKINKKEGETVQVTESVVDFMAEIPFQIKVDIYEEDIPQVKIGDPVKIVPVAFPEEELKGRVSSIAPLEKVVDRVVYYEVTVDFEEIKEGLRSGMTADVTIEAQKKEKVLAVSEASVTKENGKNFVSVFEDGKIKKREVKTGLKGTNGLIEIVSGLKEGETVVAE